MRGIPMPETDMTEVLGYYDQVITGTPETWEVMNLVLDFVRVSENELADDECLGYLANLLDHWSKQ